MRTITPISLPDDQEPDLFEAAPGPAPVQYDLFADDLLITAVVVQVTAQRNSTTSSVDTPPAGR